MKRLGAFARYWLPVAGYVALIFAVSSIHGERIPTPFPYVDKLGHLMEYALLGLVLARAIRFTMAGRAGSLAAAATIAAGAAIGFMDELYQARVPGRTYDTNDLWVDVAAVAAAVWLTRVVPARPLLGGRRTGSRAESSEDSRAR